ncbi:MAG: ISNCY-like element ISFac3 family transposase [Nitrososphaerales archaeon]
MIYDDDIRDKLKEIDEHIKKEYIESHPKEERDWRTYEQQFSKRIKEAMISIDPLIHEASSSIKIESKPGRHDALNLEQKVKLLLVKQLVGESNRMFTNMLDIFSMLSGIDISYKTVERLYSDEEVIMALHNLHVLILKKKGVEKSVDASGDGTGYSLTISKHYESTAKELKEKAKETDDNSSETASSSPTGTTDAKKRAFAYTFRLLDLSSWMYIAWGSSLKSEKDAYDRAMKMLSELDVAIDSVRLDRYYSSSSCVDSFGDRATKVFVIPKKNTTLNGSWKWKETMIEFVTNTMQYLEEYHKRSNSESGFAADKKMLGWGIAQRREDRINCAQACTGLWHNLFNLSPASV